MVGFFDEILWYWSPDKIIPKKCHTEKRKKNHLVGEIITKISSVGDANNIIPFCISHTISKLILFIE